MSGNRKASPSAGGVRHRVSHWFGQVVRCVAAGLLVTGGLAKLIDLQFFNEFLLARNDLFYALSASTELGVGLWLLTFWRSQRALQVALCLFAVFTGFSAYRLWEGWPECGCFGSFFPTKTTTMLVVDVIMLAGLFWANHRQSQTQHIWDTSTAARQAK